MIPLWWLLPLLLLGCTADGPNSIERLTDQLICEATIGVPHDARNDEGYRWIHDAVALPAEDIRHETGRTDENTGLRFAKMGLLVRPGKASTITVDPDQDAEIRLLWGYGDRLAPVHRFVIPTCEGNEDFLIYSGGLWISEPACVALTVSSGDQAVELRIPIDTDCS